MGYQLAVSVDAIDVFGQGYRIVRVYDGDPGGEFDRVAICHCLYAPLQDHDRRWRFCPVGRVSADNFGEGAEAEAAFADWKKQNPEQWKGAIRPSTPIYS